MSFFITPFFKYIDNTQQNFTPYDLFCLNSKIMKVYKFVTFYEVTLNL